MNETYVVCVFRRSDAAPAERYRGRTQGQSYSVQVASEPTVICQLKCRSKCRLLGSADDLIFFPLVI